jgi:hypothetical protein
MIIEARASHQVQRLNPAFPRIAVSKNPIDNAILVTTSAKTLPKPDARDLAIGRSPFYFNNKQ